MPIKKGMLIAVGLLCSWYHATAQQWNEYPKLEMGIQLGMTEFLGDLGGGSGDGRSFIADTDFRFTKVALGAYYKHHFKDWLALSANLNWTQVQGSDNATSNPGRNARGLEFRSNILELYGLGHFTFLRLGKYTVHGNAGLGLFHFNPRVNSENPNSQNDNYSKLQPMLPLGLGASYQLNNNWVLGADIMHRVTFTDYIDNHNSPFTNNNDSYYSLLFRLGYIFDKAAGFGRKRMGCPGQL